MKKMILSLIVVVAGTLSCFAQDDLVATLNHGSSLTTYMGEDALAQAYEAAVDGDVITLSPGVFVAVDMKKAITLRGAGYKPMASNGYVSTQITGSMSIQIPSSGTSVFTMEGLDFINGNVYITSDKKYDVVLSKSKFRGNVYGHGINLKATHCIFANLNANYNGEYNGAIIARNTTFHCQSCVISNAYCSGLDGTKMNKIIATNCFVEYYSVPYSTFTNCIITQLGSNSSIGPLPETCTAHCCVGFNSYWGSGVFNNIGDPTNVMLDEKAGDAYTKLFKTFGNSSSIYETFELTDAAKTTYLGDDGTQVGIYGGTAPFTLESTNPQVTKFVVSSTTEGSQLKVKINVE